MKLAIRAALLTALTVADLAKLHGRLRRRRIGRHAADDDHLEGIMADGSG
jgi:hypothetical protein